MENIWYERFYEADFENLLQMGRVLVIYGPRRVGKTELIRKQLNNFQGRKFIGTGDDLDLHDLFSSGKLRNISLMLGGYDLIFIDEAQRIPNIGMGLKLLVDNHQNIRVVVSGSSSIDLTDQLGEPLTGRQIQKILFPLSVLEMQKQFGGYHTHQRLEELLIFGSYPEVLNMTLREDKIQYLISLRDSYLLKDLIEIENIRLSPKLFQLLKLLAFQIGNEVSLSELGNNLGLAKQTVERYLFLLEKAFVIKRVGGYSGNLRSEIVKTARYYFWDNGVRNVVINNFNSLHTREDHGMLWENLMFIERLKSLTYKRIYSNIYFWRTYDRKEVDLVEEREGKLYGFEFKWKAKKHNPPKLWLETYNNALFEVITPDNYLEFLL